MGYRSAGDIHREKAELKLSQEFYRKALLASDSSSKETVQPEIISSLNKLGNLHFEKMDHHSALQCFKEALSIAERSLDIDHPQTIIALTSLAHLYKHQGDYGVALRAYQAALDRQERSLGANSVEVAATYSSIGLGQYLRHELENACES
jgi:tetratricopeptide (TPR) repeat protein